MLGLILWLMGFEAGIKKGPFVSFVGVIQRSKVPSGSLFSKLTSIAKILA